MVITDTFDYVFETLEQLRNLSGNAQISELSCRKSDILRQILEYTYDPHRKYKIDEGKLNKFNTNCVTERILTLDDWYKFVELLNYLKDKRSANDNDVKKVCEFITQYDEKSQIFLKQVLFKDLRLNMAIKKFQKIWSGFCVEPQVQLAQLHEGQVFEEGYYSRKFDGKRMYIMDGMAYSRANKPCKTAPIAHILEQLTDMSSDFVFDGEVLYIDMKTGREDFQKGISLTSSDDYVPDCNNLYYIIFDMIKKENFIDKQPYKHFGQEYIDLNTKLNTYGDNISWYETNLPHILVARQYENNSFATLSKACKENNWEGLMYRNGQAPYEYKRTKNLLKIKSMYDGEFKLIGMEEGTGKNQGRLGAFVIDYKGYQVKVGSGFSDIQRDVFWQKRSEFLHEEFTCQNMVKVQYFEETLNADGNLSLRFPVFLAFRNTNTGEEFIMM